MVVKHTDELGFCAFRGVGVIYDEMLKGTTLNQPWIALAVPMTDAPAVMLEGRNFTNELIELRLPFVGVKIVGFRCTPLTRNS